MTIYNDDGSVYVTSPEPDATERWSTAQRFTARVVTSTDNPPACAHGDRYDTGTFALTSTYPLSFDGLLETVGEYNAAYKVERPVMVTCFAGPNGRRAYRWSWERLTTWGGRVSDTLWVTGEWGS